MHFPQKYEWLKILTRLKSNTHYCLVMIRRSKVEHSSFLKSLSTIPRQLKFKISKRFWLPVSPKFWTIVYSSYDLLSLREWALPKNYFYFFQQNYIIWVEWMILRTFSYIALCSKSCVSYSKFIQNNYNKVPPINLKSINLYRKRHKSFL